MSKLPYSTNIISKDWLTHNVLCLKLERPEGFQFTEGQAVELTIDDPAFHHDAAPFTLTNLNSQQELELIFKVYAEHNGMTWGLSRLNIGARLFLSAPWDSFPYRGPGTFIAGGAGLTAFIPIIRSLSSQNQLQGHQLIVAQSKHRDIFLEEELKGAFGNNLSHILSRARTMDHSFGRINRAFLQFKIRNLDQYFYICGPGTFPDAVKQELIQLGADESNIFVAY